MSIPSAVHPPGLFVGLLMSRKLQSSSYSCRGLINFHVILDNAHTRYNVPFQTSSCLQRFQTIPSRYLDSSTSRNVTTAKNNVECSGVVKMLPCVLACRICQAVITQPPILCSPPSMVVSCLQTVFSSPPTLSHYSCSNTFCASVYFKC